MGAGDLEEAVLGAGWTEGIVLRYGVFYGPGTSPAPGRDQFELVRMRTFPLVGDAAGVWSFIHVADAAEATVAAIEHGSRGLYNVGGRRRDDDRRAERVERESQARAGLAPGTGELA